MTEIIHRLDRIRNFMPTRAVHFREVEPGDFGEELSVWLACETTQRDWRYSRRDGSPAEIQSTRRWSEVTCKNCLRVAKRSGWVSL